MGVSHVTRGAHMPLIIALLELAGTVLAWQDERRQIRTP
jgi:hypothetical protein